MVWQKGHFSKFFIIVMKYPSTTDLIMLLTFLEAYGLGTGITLALTKALWWLAPQWQVWDEDEVMEVRDYFVRQETREPLNAQAETCIAT